MNITWLKEIIYSIGLCLETVSISAGVSPLYPNCKRGLFVNPAEGLFPFAKYIDKLCYIFG
jgi:hypothetical protein